MLSSKMILVAENIIKDSDTNNLSLINIYEDIAVESMPIVLQRISIAIFLEKEHSDIDIFSLYLKVLNNTTSLLRYPIKVDFRGKNKNRAIIRFGGLLFQEPGIVKFSACDSDDRELCFYTLNIKIREDISVTSNPA